MIGTKASTFSPPVRKKRGPVIQVGSDPDDAWSLPPLLVRLRALIAGSGPGTLTAGMVCPRES